ncbi:hypothetical protein NC653_024640 [Populus alba x Populus x berolinensis]|uniref:Uncharacterized protein n=1 Tax=Populus alba x Populus x berolinensis TaxID=444605 RepID=A0AAD6M9B9_9ROSI|nr:hypothetical protein NC653_024640 [Populus alba x Populus x berolinensis]
MKGKVVLLLVSKAELLPREGLLLLLDRTYDHPYRKKFPEWEENVAKLGFVSALRATIDPPPPPPPPPPPLGP